MPSRSIRLKSDTVHCLAVLGLLVLTPMAHALDWSEVDYTVIRPDEPKHPPPVVVVAPSAPLPIHEVIVEPVVAQRLTGENRVFAQIMAAGDEVCMPGSPCELDLEAVEPDAQAAPERLLPDAPGFGRQREVIEL